MTTIQVDEIPQPQTEQAAAGGDAPGPGAPPEPGASTTDVAAAGDRWTDADLARLKEIVAQPYKMLADSTGEPWIALNDLQQLAIAAPMTSWMPVSWVRGADGQNIPPLLGAVITAAAVAVISGVRLAKWNHEHPDQFVAVPFITRGGPRRGPSAPAQAPRPRDVDAQRDARPSDRDEAPAAPVEPAPTGNADGGPVADTIDDIRSSYQAR